MRNTAVGYVVRKLADAPSVPCPCGVSTRPLTAADGAPCSLHVTAITDSARHYHRGTTRVRNSAGVTLLGPVVSNATASPTSG